MPTLALQKIVEPINGFIILDLHNVYCQSKNFQIDLLQLIQNYPLHLVREIHISGGSWVESQLVNGKMIRRDTHDDTVPNEIFNVFPLILEKCPNLKFVILEQIGSSLVNELYIENYQQDFFRIKKIVSSMKKLSPITNHFKPNISFIQSDLNDQDLYNDQTSLIQVFTEASSAKVAIEKLQHQPLHYNWQIEKWQPAMIETCYDIIQKWK